MSKTARRLLLILFVVAVFLLMIYRSRGSIGLEDFNWELLGASVAQAKLSWLLLSLAGIYAAYALRALRWVRFSRYIKGGGFASVYVSTLIGFTAVFLLGRAGEPVRPLLIARKDGVPVSSAFGTYVLERVFDLASTAVIAGLALLVFTPATDPGGSKALLTTARTAGAVLFAGLLGLVSFLVYFRLHGAGALERRLAGWRTRPGWHARAAGLFAGFSEGLGAIRTLGDLGAAVGYSVLHWAVIALIYLWVPLSFGGRLAEIGFFGGLMVLAFTMVGSTLQLPGVGGGSQVASFLAFTVIFGVEKEPAAAASIVLWLLTFAGSSLAGVPLLIREGWSMGELRRLARAEREAEAVGSHVSLPGATGPSQEVGQ